MVKIGMPKEEAIGGRALFFLSVSATAREVVELDWYFCFCVRRCVNCLCSDGSCWI